MVILEKMARLYKRDQKLSQTQINAEKVSLAGSVESKIETDYYSESEMDETEEFDADTPVLIEDQQSRYSIASAVVKPNGILKLRLKLLNWRKIKMKHLLSFLFCLFNQLLNFQLDFFSYQNLLNL